jgi:flagellar hook-associated protein 3 FlgL
MTRISTQSQNDLVLFYMQKNENALTDLSTQVSTGITAQTYAGIAPDAAHLVNFQSQVARQTDFNNTIDTVTTRLQAMQLSVSQIQTEVQQFRGLIPTGAFSTTQPDVSTQAKSLLQDIAGYLNSQDGTRYLFAGTQSNTPPVDLTNLPTGAAATLTAPVNGPPSANGYYAGGPPIAPVRVDQQVTVNYGITAADANTFEPIIRVLNYLANNGPFSSTSPTDNTNLSTAGTMLDQALTGLSSMLGNISLQTAQLNNEKTLHTSTINLAQTQIGNIESVDQATAVTKLNLLETQLEASFSATSSIDKLSLVNFMG